MALDSRAHSRVRIDFDTPSVEEAQRNGVSAYREFHIALGYPENADPAETGPKDYNPYDGGVEDMRRKSLLFLPRPSANLPLRTLARIAGHATWGDLEVFYRHPNAPGTELPASAPLREWYARYVEDFDTCFREHRLPNVRSGLAENPAPDFIDFPSVLKETAIYFTAAAERSFGSVVLLGVLLRDYATELRSLAHGFNFSIDDVMRHALLSLHRGDSYPDVFAYYEEIVNTEGVPPGPGAMLAALAIPGLPEIDFALPKNDLLPALARIAQPTTEVGEGTEPPSETSTASVPPNILGHANSDQPTEQDRIGVTPLVEGLRELLDDERTGLGLSIGVTAPWGGGKSSVMRQLSAALTNARRGRSREWIPIHFDAWKYERSERLWAALSKAIYEQGLERMSRRERILFKFRLEGSRRGWFGFLVFPLLVASLLIAGGVILALNVSLAAGALTVAATLLGFSGFAASVWGLLSDPFKRALAGYTADPIYEEQLGFTSEADADIRRLTKQLTEGRNRALIVFVDDLDRCSPRHIVEAVEAINQIFNASEESRCVFILGMDRDLIAASIEVAYAETIQRLPPARRTNFGLHFLSKVVQLSVAVPAPDVEGIHRLLDSIGHGLSLRLPKGGPFYAEPRPRGPDGTPVSRDAEAPSVVRDAEFESTQDGSAFEPDTADREVDESSPAFHIAERLAVRYLDPNPREVKRFDNAFRLQLQVARRTDGCELEFDENDLIAIGSWVAMRLRWPDLAVAIDRDGELLRRLEEDANGVSESTDEPWATIPELTELLREELPARRIARLQDQNFLRIS